MSDPMTTTEFAGHYPHTAVARIRGLIIRVAELEAKLTTADQEGFERGLNQAKARIVEAALVEQINELEVELATAIAVGNESYSYAGTLINENHDLKTQIVALESNLLLIANRAFDAKTTTLHKRELG